MTDLFDPGLQPERTELAWRRTALSLFAAGLLVAQLAVRDLGAVALAATLIGTAAAVGFVWLNPDQRTGVAGLGLAPRKAELTAVQAAVVGADDDRDTKVAVRVAEDGQQDRGVAQARSRHASSSSRSSTVSRLRIGVTSPSRTSTAAGRPTPL